MLRFRPFFYMNGILFICVYIYMVRIPPGVIHGLFGVSHKAIEEEENKLCKLRRDYVEATEKTVKFGDGKGWHDVEADEATFDKKGCR